MRAVRGAFFSNQHKPLHQIFIKYKPHNFDFYTQNLKIDQITIENNNKVSNKKTHIEGK